MPVTNGYCTLAQLKMFLSIADATDDTLLEFAINAASRTIDSHCNRRFYLDGNASARRFRPSNTGELWVDDIGSIDGLLIKTDDDNDGTFETTWAASDFQVYPDNAITTGRPVYRIEGIGSRLFTTTMTRPSVEVTAKWGWPSVPDMVLQACLMMASRLFKRKDSPEGVAGFGEFGVVRLIRVDPDVEKLLSEFRIPVVA